MDVQTLMVQVSVVTRADYIVLQIGRSTESPIDFVVTDTVSGGQEGDETPITQSTISRFACRVVCERVLPYTARIYAAGFDSSKNIFLGVRLGSRGAVPGLGMSQGLIGIPIFFLLWQ